MLFKAIGERALTRDEALTVTNGEVIGWLPTAAAQRNAEVVLEVSEPEFVVSTPAPTTTCTTSTSTFRAR